MEVGEIVISLAGHDAGRAYIVTSVVSSDFVLVADGKTRKLENPKLKRIRHLRAAGASGIDSPTNAALDKRIKKFRSERRLYAEE